MKSKAITICALILIMGSLLIFTGCEPNVNHGGAGGTGTTPLHTTPRVTTTTPHHTTPHTTTTEEKEAVGGNPTAFSFSVADLRAFGGAQRTAHPTSGGKIGWGLGKAVDERNRPLDALSAQSKFGELGAIFIDEDTDNKIYLTFDEGYENGFSPAILDVLREKGVKATFFVTYDYCKDEPELIKRMLDEGHEVGNHSFSHPSFPDISDAQVREEIMKLHDYVKENFGCEMRLIRFPRGEFTECVLELTQELGYRSVFWSFAYVDWNVDSQPNPDEAFGKITAATHPGAVVLLHAVSSTNAGILGDVLDYWVGNGFEVGLFE